MPEKPLTRRKRLRRTALLCGDCIRNLAYYRAGRDGGDLLFDSNLAAFTAPSTSTFWTSWRRVYHRDKGVTGQVRRAHSAEFAAAGELFA
jgi:hypothetical protein